MNTCGVCGGALKPLMTSWFCPKDCDRLLHLTITAEFIPWTSVTLFARPYRAVALKSGDTLPQWATIGSWVGLQYDNSKLQDLVTKSTFWSIPQPGVEPGKPFQSPVPSYWLLAAGLETP